MSYPSLQILGDIFKNYPEIQAVYLFGSTATGKLNAESDLDLAIVSTDPFIQDRKLDILTDLAKHGFCSVDLIFLNGDDIVLQYEAIRQNILVYYTSDFDRGEIYSQIVRKYLDFYPYLQVQRQAYKKRIMSG